MGTITLSKASGTGQVRVFRDDGADGEVILGPEATEPSRDLWADLQASSLCLLVEGCQPGVVDLALTYSFADTTSTDQVRISVVDVQVPDSIYQLEMLTHEWDLGLPSGDAPAVRDRLVYKVVSGGSALIMLDPASTDLAPATPLGIDSEGRPCYAFGTGLRALGKAQDYDYVEFGLYVSHEGGLRKVWDNGLLAVPLTMSQRVIPPDYGFAGDGMSYADQAHEHGYGLFGHAGVLEARAEVNELADRDVDFTRSGLTWTTSPGDPTEPLPVFVRGSGEGVAGNPAAVRIYGASPRVAIIKVDRPGILFNKHVHAPGRNMYRVVWEDDAWFEPTEFEELKGLFTDSGLPVWCLQHPYTEVTIRYMMSERQDLAEALVPHLIAAQASSGAEPIDRFPGLDPEGVTVQETPLKLTLKGPLFTPIIGTDVAVAIDASLGWETGWIRVWEDPDSYEPTAAYRLSGESIFEPDRVDLTKHVFETGQDYPLPGNGYEVIGADFEALFEADHFEEAVVYRAIKEWYDLRKLTAQMGRYIGWQQIAQDWGSVGMYGFWASDIVPLPGVSVPAWYQLLNKKDFVTDEGMSNTEYAINGVFMLIDCIPALKPLKAGGGAVKALASGVKKAARDVGQEVAEQGLGDAAAHLARYAGQQARDIGQELLEKATALSVKQVVKGALVPVGKLKTYGIAIGIRAKSVIPGVALKSQCLHEVSKRGVRSVAKYIEWEDATRLMLKEADGAFWTDDVLETLFKNACFVAGTPVVMADGSLKPIEEIKVGDKVLSRHESGKGPLVSAEVTRTFCREVDHIRVLKIRANKPQTRSRSPRNGSRNRPGTGTGDKSADEDDEDDSDDAFTVIRTTDEHPFCVSGVVWVPASSLSPGERLYSAYGPGARLVESSRISVADGAPVHNLQVTETHTYFVGPPAVWAHNMCEPYEKFKGFLKGVGEYVDDTTALRTYRDVLAGELPTHVRDLAEAHIARSGITVLGRWPGYIEKAERLGASYFSIDVFNSLPTAHKFASNRHFLDKIADAGDEILLSVRKRDIPLDRWLAHEIDYLVSEKGYRWVNQWCLKKR